MTRFLTCWLIVVSSTFCVSCAAFFSPVSRMTDIQYDLSGRIRVSEGESILRGDFRLTQTEDLLRVSVHGPMGFGRVEVIKSGDSIEVTQKGEKIELEDPSSLNSVLPGGDWLLDVNLVDWLTLQPSEKAKSDNLVRWRGETGSVFLSKTQKLNDRVLCKRVEVRYEDIEITLLCDRWRVLGGEVVKL